jgi:hypothetical protein
VEVQGVSGALELQSAAGAVRVSDVSGALNLRTSLGLIDGRGLRSAHVEAFGSAGGISLSFATAPERVRIENHAGGVSLELPGGPYQINAVTDLGKVRLGVPTSPDSAARIDLRTSMGGIDVRPTVKA